MPTRYPHDHEQGGSSCITHSYRPRSSRPGGRRGRCGGVREGAGGSGHGTPVPLTRNPSSAGRRDHAGQTHRDVAYVGATRRAGRNGRGHAGTNRSSNAREGARPSRCTRGRAFSVAVYVPIPPVERSGRRRGPRRDRADSRPIPAALRREPVGDRAEHDDREDADRPIDEHDRVASVGRHAVGRRQDADDAGLDDAEPGRA